MNKTMINKLLASTIVTLFSLPTFASNPEDEFIRKGNDKYEAKDFKGAEDQYRKALDKNGASKVANYNMGNTYYRRNEYESALENYKMSINDKNTNEENAAIMHNIGNTYLQNKKYEESIDAYKKSLKLNPNDEDTRYNLAYAKKMLQQQQQQQQNQQNQQQQQQQQQNQDQEPPKDGKEQENHDQRDDAREGEHHMDQNTARQLLEALERDEKDKQDERMKMQMQNAKKKRIEKDW